MTTGKLRASRPGRPPDSNGLSYEFLAALASTLDGGDAKFSAMLSFDEIDFLDFTALTYLGASHHDLFDSLSAWEDELRSGKRCGAPHNAEAMSEPEWSDGVAAVVRHGNPEVPHQVLSFLFPRISVQRMSYFVEHDKALSNERSFQRYFIAGVADDDVEDGLVRSAIDQLTQGVSSSEGSVKLAKVLDGSPGQVVRGAVFLPLCGVVARYSAKTAVDLTDTKADRPVR